MSKLLKAIGIVFAAAGAIVVFYGMTFGEDLWSYVLFFLGLVGMSIGFSLLTAGRGGEEMEPPPPTVTEIRCSSPDCDFKEIRDFEEGDYVLKVLDKGCPKCEAEMVIEGVYVVREEEEAEKGRFSVPQGQGEGPPPSNKHSMF
ncbi:MAG: hypothetical protein KGY80_02065 [Candidatus Thorarchaeota archaeon]|nr:hypothetical protein [Candidatus Thorarchaeota archaeon]